MSIKRVLLTVLTSLAFACAAHADMIGPNCSTCFGDTYLLTYSPTGTAGTYHVSLAVGTSGYNGGGTTLDAVAIKIVSNISDFSTVTLLSAPTLPGGDTWNTQLSTLNANGCSGGAAGYICDQPTSSTDFGLTVPDGTYTWTWQVVMAPSGVLLTGTNAASVKALYLLNGQQHGLTSEDITLQSGNSPVPEPSSLALLGTGAVGIAALMRRKLLV